MNMWVWSFSFIGMCKCWGGGSNWHKTAFQRWKTTANQ